MSKVRVAPWEMQVKAGPPSGSPAGSLHERGEVQVGAAVYCAAAVVLARPHPGRWALPRAGATMSDDQTSGRRFDWIFFDAGDTLFCVATALKNIGPLLAELSHFPEYGQVKRAVIAAREASSLIPHVQRGRTTRCQRRERPNGGPDSSTSCSTGSSSQHHATPTPGRGWSRRSPHQTSSDAIQM